MPVYRVRREYSSMEYIVKPFVEAAHTEGWKNVLNILYLSGHVAAFSEDYKVPCLVSAEGPYDEIEQSVDLVEGKTKVAIAPMISDVFRTIFPMIMTVVQTSKITATNENIFAMKMMAAFKADEEKLKKTFNRLAIQGTSILSDLISIGTFKSLLEIRDAHIHSAFDEDEYEMLIDMARRLGLVESKLQVSLCPGCANCQFTIARSPIRIEACPRCGSEWATVTLYLFEPPFREIKMDNSDLPLFISSYLKHKIFAEAPTAEVKILPKAEIDLNGETVEADVYIPEYATGIECKVYEDAYASLTQSRLGSIVDPLVKQIKGYSRAGITKVIVVTNLKGSSANKLKDALGKKLMEERRNHPIEVFEVLPGDINVLLGKLDKHALGIAQSVNKKLERALQKSQKEKKAIIGQIIEPKKAKGIQQKSEGKKRAIK